MLVDPLEESRLALQQSLRNVRTAWLADVCVELPRGLRNGWRGLGGPGDRGPRLRPQQALRLIDTIGQQGHGTEVLPASRVRNSSLDSPA